VTRALIAAVGGSALLAGLDKIPGWDFISQCLAIGAAIGLAVAYHAKRLDPDRDVWVLQARWSIAGLAIGVAIRLLVAVLSWL
jgi:hypothetical protein